MSNITINTNSVNFTLQQPNLAIQETNPVDPVPIVPEPALPIPAVADEALTEADHPPRTATAVPPVPRQIQGMETTSSPPQANMLMPSPSMPTQNVVKFGNEVTLYLDDMFNALPRIKDDVDMACCDLPYATETFGRCIDQIWDEPISLDRFWAELEKCLKPTAVVTHFCNIRFGFELMRTNLKAFRYDLVYEKPDSVTGHKSSGHRPLTNHELILTFVRKGQFLQSPYHPQKKPGGQIVVRKVTRKSGGVFSPTKDCVSYTDGMKLPVSVLSFPHDRGASNRKPLHPTRKPVALLRWLIRTYSNENDIILDPCFGSGTTIVAAILEGRRVVGIEKDESYFNVAVERITAQYNALQQANIHKAVLRANRADDVGLGIPLSTNTDKEGDIANTSGDEACSGRIPPNISFPIPIVCDSLVMPEFLTPPEGT